MGRKHVDTAKASKSAEAGDIEAVPAVSSAFDADEFSGDESPNKIVVDSLPDADAHFDTPPSKSPIGGQEEKIPGQIYSQRPICPMCGTPMHANRTKHVRSTHQVYRFYYCKNEDCTNKRGQMMVLNSEAKRIIDAKDSHGRIQEMNVAARSDMQDTEGT